jgi:GMP synthase-like glutamine amidotransferase
MPTVAKRPTLTRRRFLRLAGLVALSKVVAACSSPPISILLSTNTPTAAPTRTPTPAPSPTTTSTQTVTPTATATSSPTATATATPTATQTPTATATETPTATSTPSPTPTRGPLNVIVLIHGAARVLVVDNQLKRFDVVRTNIRVDLKETVPDLRDYDAVICAGGEYGPNEFDDPIFDVERERMMEALEADLPILGICLGHQLIAHWLGGEVRPGKWEVGWLPIEVNEAGLSDPMLADLGETFYGFLWHGDEITRLPEGAVLLASSERCPVQVYRLGDHPVWGLQFNPQYDPVIAESLLRNSPWVPKAGWNVDELVAAGYREYNDLGGKIFGNFLQAVLTG